MSKYTRFSRSVFKVCDIMTKPLSNWWRRNTKGLTFEIDVPYGTEPLQKGDIYCQTELKDELKPVIINIHGGGFVGGDKSNRIALSIWYANLGFFVFNINYGLAPERPFPYGPADCVKAYNWLYENADKYKIDKNKIILSGDSAGGYMVSAIAAASYSKELQACYGEKPVAKPYAVVLNCGICDIETALHGKMIFNMTPKIAIDVCGVTLDELDRYEHRKYLSTFDYITAEFPKAFVAYSGRDIFVPGQGEKLIAKLKELGTYVEWYEGKRIADNHVFPLFWDLPSAKECNKMLQEFLLKIKSGEL